MQETKVYNWNLQDIFKNEEEFNKEKDTIKEILKEIKKYQGKLCDTSDNLYNCYRLYEQALEKYEKVYSYGMLTYHLDMSNQEGIKLYKEVETLGTEFSVATSFITPEITYADEIIIQNYLKMDNRLNKYARDINDILEKKKHVLSKEEENLIANYSEMFSAPENTFDILTNAEFKFGKLIDDNGEEVELTDSTYSLYLKSQKQDVRKQAFNLMYKKYSEFVNTITEMYMTNVKAKTTTAKLRKYSSSLEKAVENDDASIKVYNSLIEAVNENISSNYEFLKLKKKMLNLPEMHMYDLYVNPCEQGKDEISFEDAKQEVLNALQVLGEEYTNKLKEAFSHNWIDVFAKPNKRGGAYSMGVYGVHPFVLANFVNSKRDVSTIAHELGHILLHPWSENLELVSKEEFKNREKQANMFASAFLLPADSFGKDIQAYPTDWQYYQWLKKKWKVSMQAMAYRCRELKIITSNQFQYMMRQLSKKGWRITEPEDVPYYLHDNIFQGAIDLLKEEKILSSNSIIQTFKRYGISMYPTDIEDLLGLRKGTLDITEVTPRIIQIKSYLDN